MLSGRHAEAFHLLRAVILLKKTNTGNRIAAFEIDQMCSGSDCCCLLARYATIAKIVQLEINERRISGALQCRNNYTTNGARQCSNRRRVPDFKQQRFKVIGKPEAFG